MAYPEFGGGGSGSNSFAIGPTPNEFRANTRQLAIGLLEAQTLADPAWLQVYDDAPMSQEEVAPLNIKLFYNLDGNSIVDLMARDNGVWVVNQSFEGVVGQQGAASTVPGPAGKDSEVPGPQGKPGKDGAGVTPADQEKLDAITIVDGNFTVSNVVTDSVVAKELTTGLNSLSFDDAMILGSGGEGLILTNTSTPNYDYNFIVTHDIKKEWPQTNQFKSLIEGLTINPEGDFVLTDPSFSTVLPESLMMVNFIFHMAEPTGDDAYTEISHAGRVIWRMSLANLPAGKNEIKLNVGKKGLYPIEMFGNHQYDTTMHGVKVLGVEATGYPWLVIDYKPAVAFDIKPSDGGTDKKVSVTSRDLVPGYLSDKLKTGAGLTLAVINPGEDEDYVLTIDNTPGPGGSATVLQCQIEKTTATPGLIPLLGVEDPDSILLSNMVTIPTTGYYLAGFSISAETSPPDNFDVRFGTESNYVSSGEIVEYSEDVTVKTIGAAGIIHATAGDIFTLTLNVLGGSPTVLSGASSSVYLAQVGIVGGGGSETNLSSVAKSSTVDINNDNGTGATIPEATTSKAGVLSGTDKDKLNGIADGAQVNSGRVKVKESGSWEFLGSKILAGENVTLDTTDDNITVNAKGGGSVDIGGIEVGDIYKRGLRFTTPGGKGFVIPQVEYDEFTREMGTPFFFNKGTGSVITYESINRVDTNAIQIKSGGSQQMLADYDGQPINKITVKVAGNHPGVKFTLVLRYTNQDGRPSTAYTESIISTDAVQELTVNLKSSIALDMSGQHMVKVGADYSSSDVVELMGESAAFAEELWIDWIAESVGGITNLATEDFVKGYTELAFEGQWGEGDVQMIGPGNVFSGTLPAGKYKVEYGCTCKSKDGGIRAAQLEFFSNNTTVSLQQNAVPVIGTQPFSGNVSGVTYFESGEGNEWHLRFSATNFKSTFHSNTYCFITRIG